VISPQGGSSDGGDAHQRLAHTLERLHQAGLDAVGQVMDPDPFTAIQNALQFYAVDEIVISTFPANPLGMDAGETSSSVSRRRPRSRSSTSS